MSRRRFALVLVLLGIAVAAALSFARRDEPRDDAASGEDDASASIEPGPRRDASGLTIPGRGGRPGRIKTEIDALAAANAGVVWSISTRREGDPDRSLLLRVFVGDGRAAVVGAVVVVEADGAEPTSGVTDARGEFRIAAVPRSATTLRVSAESRLPLVVRGVQPGTIEVLLRLLTEVSGIIVDERDGSPIAGAQTRAVPRGTGSDASKPLFEASTDASGQPDDDLDDAVRPEPHALDGSGVPVAPGTVFVELTDETGSPVPGARVTLYAGRYPGVEVGGAASVHRLDRIPVGRHSLRVESSLGPAREQVVDVVSGPNRISIRLDAGVRVDGEVVEAKGLAVARARVSLEREPVENEPEDVRTTTTDARGRYAFGGLAAGRWRLTASASGASTSEPVAVTAPQRGVRVKVVRFGRVRGRLVRAAGGVLTGDVEILRLRGDEVVSQTDTLVDGAFVVDGFGAEDETIEIDAEGFAPVRREVRVPAEGELDLGVITMTAGHRFAGVVVDGRGLPVEGAILLVAHHGRTITDPNGRFAFDGVPPGPLSIVVVAERYLRKSFEVAAESAASLRVELSSGAHVEGTVVGADGQGVGGLPLAIVPADGPGAGEPVAALRTDEDGTFEVRVPPGRYRIEAKDDGATTTTVLADLTLADGDGLKPTLVFRPR